MKTTTNSGNFAAPLHRFITNLSGPEVLNTTKPVESGTDKKTSPTEKKTTTGSNANWKVFVFFLPGSSSNPKPPKLPDDKHWLELLLMLLKVVGAIYALVKAVGVLS